MSVARAIILRYVAVIFQVRLLLVALWRITSVVLSAVAFAPPL
jgi:hypothetical protein